MPADLAAPTRPVICDVLHSKLLCLNTIIGLSTYQVGELQGGPRKVSHYTE